MHPQTQLKKLTPDVDIPVRSSLATNGREHRTRYPGTGRGCLGVNYVFYRNPDLQAFIEISSLSRFKESLNSRSLAMHATGWRFYSCIEEAY